MSLGMEVSLGPGHIVLDRDPIPQRGTSAPTFWPMSFVAKRLDGLQYHLVRTTEVCLGPGDIVFHGDPAFPTERGKVRLCGFHHISKTVTQPISKSVVIVLSHQFLGGGIKRRSCPSVCLSVPCPNLTNGAF